MQQHIIAIASHKGGVGKTTTALNLAYSLSRIGGSVLVIDTDPQGGLGISAKLAKRNELGLVDLLEGRATQEEIITHTRDKKMAMVGMGRVSVAALKALEEASHERLEGVLRELSHHFQTVVIDTPAGVGPITRAVLNVATGVLLPVNAKNTTTRSLPLFLRVVEQIQTTTNPNLVLEGMVVTMLDYANSHEIAIRRELKESLPPGVLFNSFILHNVRYEEASIKGIPIAMTRNGKDAARGYMNLALELLARQTERNNGKEEDHVDGLF